MRNPVLSFFRQVDEWLREQAESLDGVDERTLRRWFNEQDPPSGDGARNVTARLWKRCAEPRKHPEEERKRGEFKQRLFQALHDMDPDVPGEDASEHTFAAYFQDLAERCRSQLSLEVLVERARGEKFRVVTENGVAPVPSGSKVRVKATATHPVFLHLLWIDSQGAATPLYPWQPNSWEHLQPSEPVAVLDLPADQPYWEINTPAGLETCVAMASVFRVSDATLTGLANRLMGLHTPRGMSQLPKVAGFASDEPAASGERLNTTPHIPERELLAWRHRELIQRLQAAAFDRVVGWSFANAGDKVGKT